MANRLSAAAAEDYRGRYDRAKQADAEKDTLISVSVFPNDGEVDEVHLIYHRRK